MRFLYKLSIGLQLTVVAVLIAGMSIVAMSALSLQAGKRVLTEHEVVDLADECNLRMAEMREELRFLSRDVRALGTHLLGALRAGRPDTDQIVGQLRNDAQVQAKWVQEADTLVHPDDAKTDRLIEFMRTHLDADSFVEVACVDLRGAAPAAVRVRRPRDGVWQGVPADGLSPCAAELCARMQAEQRQGGSRDQLPSTSHATIMDRPGGGGPICAVAFGAALYPGGGGGRPQDLVVVATVDFTRYIGNRARTAPRHLFFVYDPAGRLLVHPDPDWHARARTEPTAAGPDWGFDPSLWNVPDKEVVDVEARLLRSRGAKIADPVAGVAVPELAFSHAKKKLPVPADQPPAYAEFLKAVNDRLQELAARDRHLRYLKVTPASDRMEVSHPDPATLLQVMERLNEVDREFQMPLKWQEPLRCATFTPHLVRMRLDLSKPKTDDALRLVLVGAVEEIEAEVGREMKVLWTQYAPLVLAVACVLALAAALVLTRPLSRITRAAQRLAAGDYHVSLPRKALGEVGDLALAFGHMTEQVRRREGEVQANLARMDAILTTASEGIITFDALGRVERANRAAEQMFGYPAGKLEGQQIWSLIEDAAPPDGDPAAAFAAFTHSADLRRGRRADGAGFWLEAGFSEVPLEGQKLVTGIFRDVTRRKETEDEILQLNERLDARVRERTAELEEAKGKLEVALQEAHAAGKAKDMFVANVSHELRQPLNIIIGYTEDLLDTADAAGLDDLTPDLQKVNSASKHLLQQVNDLLDLAKDYAGQLKLDVEDFDLGPLLAELADWADPLVKKNHNEFELDAPDPAGRMRSDPKRVRQVLLNLVSNAAKFTSRGRVTLRVRRETAGGREWVAFTVADTGHGMNEAQVRQLFQPFFQADSSTTRRQGGTGLGLTISRRFAERMGGTIGVISQVGVGSEFVVRLPAAIDEAPASTRPADPTTPESATAPTGSTVLVIDDDPEVHELLRRSLTREGYRVLTAGTGEDGLRLAKDHHPAVITLDVMMPGVDGWAVLAALKTDAITQDIPVVMLTMIDDRSRGYALGAADYLTKPIDRQRLGGILRRYAAARPADPVLVVDDDPDNRELVRRLLAREGWQVAEAEHGRAALEWLADHRTALILLDLMMPEMDGFQFLEELHRRGWSDAPVVVLTAKVLTDDDRHRLNGGVARILQKGNPADVQELLRQLHQRFLEVTAAGGGGAWPKC